MDVLSRPLHHRKRSHHYVLVNRDGVLKYVLLPEMMHRIRNGVSKPDMA